MKNLFQKYLCIFLVAAYLLQFDSQTFAQYGKAPSDIIPAYLSDSRLDKKVSVEATGVSLKQFVKSFGLTGLTLGTIDNCKELKVQARIVNRPVKEIMSSLAELFQGKWETLPEKKGYYFTLTKKTLDKREGWWNHFQAERERAIGDLKANMLEATKRDLETHAANEAEDSRKAAEIAKRTRSVFKDLPREFLQQLAERVDLDYLYLGYKDSRDDEGALPVLLKDLPESFTTFLQSSSTSLPNYKYEPESTYTALEFIFVGDGIEATVARPGQAGSAFFGRDNITTPILTLSRLEPYHERLPDFLKQFPKESTPGLEYFAKIQKERVWKNTLPTVHQNYVNAQAIRPVRWQKLKWLSEKSGIEFLSDYHSTFGYKLSEAEMKQKPKKSVEEELNELGVIHDLSWKKSANNLYLVKNNRWYRDDYMEVPAGFLNKLLSTELPNTIGNLQDANAKPKNDPASKSEDALKKKKERLVAKMRLWLDRAALIATNLSQWQIAKGLKFYQPDESGELSDSMKMFVQREANFFAQYLSDNDTRNLDGIFAKDSDYILSRYRTLCFYATLSKEMRTKLLGEGLPFEELNQDQQERAIWILPRIGMMLLQHDDSPKVLVLIPTFNFDSFTPSKLFLKSHTLGFGKTPGQ